MVCRVKTSPPTLTHAVAHLPDLRPPRVFPACIEVLQELELAANVDCSAEDDVAEQLTVDVLRATERQQQGAGLGASQCAPRAGVWQPHRRSGVMPTAALMFPI